MGPGLTHAWAEIFLPAQAGRLKAVGGYNLIPLAVGRVIAQAMPMTGTFLGTTDVYLGLSVDGEVVRLRPFICPSTSRSAAIFSTPYSSMIWVPDRCPAWRTCSTWCQWCSARRCDHCLPHARPPVLIQTSDVATSVTALAGKTRFICQVCNFPPGAPR